MTATYPLRNPFLNSPGKTSDPKSAAPRTQESSDSSLGADRQTRKAGGSPDIEEDNYHLGRMIYTL